MIFSSTVEELSAIPINAYKHRYWKSKENKTKPASTLQMGWPGSSLSPHRVFRTSWYSSNWFSSWIKICPSGTQQRDSLSTLLKFGWNLNKLTYQLEIMQIQIPQQNHTEDAFPSKERVALTDSALSFTVMILLVQKHTYVSYSGDAWAQNQLSGRGCH